MIVRTHYRQGAKKAGLRTYYMTRYIGQQHGEELYNSHGQIMSDEERLAFVQRSREYGNEREFVISPEYNMTREELDIYTREFMDSWKAEGNRRSIDYVYAIHQNTDNYHVHVIVNGVWPDLKLDRLGLFNMRELAKSLFHENGLSVIMDIERMIEKMIKRTLTLGVERVIGL